MTDLEATPGSILVPVDFSAHSAAALELAAELADRLDAPLLVLHVLHDPAAAPGYYADVDREGQVASLEDRAREMLEKKAGILRDRRILILGLSFILLLFAALLGVKLRAIRRLS